MRLAQSIGELSLRRQTGVLRKGVSSASDVVRGSAKQLAAYDTGALKRSITKKIKVYREGDLVMGFVGPDSRYYENGKPIKREAGETPGEYEGRLKGTGKKRPSRYAHFVEFGVNGIPAQPFIRPAVDNNTALIEKTLGAACKDAIEREFDTLDQ